MRLPCYLSLSPEEHHENIAFLTNLIEYFPKISLEIRFLRIASLWEVGEKRQAFVDYREFKNNEKSAFSGFSGCDENMQWMVNETKSRVQLLLQEYTETKKNLEDLTLHNVQGLSGTNTGLMFKLVMLSQSTAVCIKSRDFQGALEKSTQFIELAGSMQANNAELSDLFCSVYNNRGEAYRFLGYEKEAMQAYAKALYLTSTIFAYRRQLSLPLFNFFS